MLPISILRRMLTIPSLVRAKPKFWPLAYEAFQGTRRGLSFCGAKEGLYING